MKRSANLRLAALAGAVVLVSALPLAVAMAGPAHAPADDGAAGKRGKPGVVTPSGPAPSPSGTSAPGGPADGAARVVTAAAPFLDLPPLPGSLPAGLQQDKSCGPALRSREGLHAQTCVLREGGQAWARTYYRNHTGDPLSMSLALMRPDGGSVQVHCAVGATADIGTCETPRQDAEAGNPEGHYGAVAEAASPGSSRLVLRSGSNAAE
jgi:hypothetical protein